MKISRWLLVLLALLALALCATHVRAGQHAQHRGGSSSRHSSSRSGSGGQHAQSAHPKGGSGQHAVPRDPGRYNGQGARERQPRPGVGRYDAYRYRNGGSRSYSSRYFPRSYGFSYFYGYRYHGMWFRPHYRYWNGFSYFYWPWYDAPLYGCGWYWLPTHREPEPPPDGDEGEQGWGYDDWGWVYVCMD